MPTGEKNAWAQGDFLTIYRTGGIVYFLHISQRVHLWAPFTTSNRQVGRDTPLKIRWWLINGLATGFNTQIYNYLYFSLNCQHLFSNTNMLLSIFVNMANSFILFLALFPLLDRVINRVFHLARILPVALERQFYTYCSKTAHSWHIFPQTLLTFTLPFAYFSLDFTLKIACSYDTYQRLGCLDIWKKKKKKNRTWTSILPISDPCNSTAICKNDLRWLPVRSISILRS